MAWNYLQEAVDRLDGYLDVTVGAGGLSRDQALAAVQGILDGLAPTSPYIGVAADRWRHGAQHVDAAGTSWQIYEYPDGDDPAQAAAARYDTSPLTDTDDGDGLVVSLHRFPETAV